MKIFPSLLLLSKECGAKNKQEHTNSSIPDSAASLETITKIVLKNNFDYSDTIHPQSSILIMSVFCNPTNHYLFWRAVRFQILARRRFSVRLFPLWNYYDGATDKDWIWTRCNKKALSPLTHRNRRGSFLLGLRQSRYCSPLLSARIYGRSVFVGATVKVRISFVGSTATQSTCSCILFLEGYKDTIQHNTHEAYVHWDGRDNDRHAIWISKILIVDLQSRLTRHF